MKKMPIIASALFVGLSILANSPAKINKASAYDSYDGKEINEEYLTSIDTHTSIVGDQCPYYTIDIASIDATEIDNYCPDEENHSLTFYLYDDLTVKGPISFKLTDDYYVINLYMNSHVVSFEQVDPTYYGGFFNINVDNLSTDNFENTVFNLYGGSETTKNYFKRNSYTHHYVRDDYGSICYEGGCLNNFKSHALFLDHDIEYNIFDLNIIGCEAAVSLLDNCKVNLYNCKIENNYANDTGTSIIHVLNNANGDVGDLLLDGCSVKNNVTQDRSAIFVEGSYENSTSYCGVTVLNNTDIVDNYSESNYDNVSAGITIDYSAGGCFAEGSQVYLPSGETTNIENVQEGDNVLTFNHDTGVLESQKVLETYVSNQTKQYFTLNFSNNINVDVVEGHAFLNKEYNKYINVTNSNASKFIGTHFYNAINDRWETLESVTYSNELVKYYSFYTGCNFNAIVDSMLTLEDDVTYVNNAFELADGKVFDQIKKQNDIDTYGLYDFEQMPTDMPEEEFYIKKLQYCKIYVGKRLVSREYLLGIAGNYANQKQTTSNKLKASRLTPLKSVKSDYSYSVSSYSDKTGLVIASNVKIKNNYVGNKKANLFLKSSATEGNYISPYILYANQCTNNDIFLRTDCPAGIFSENMTNDTYLSYFTSDRDDIKVTHFSTSYYESAAKPQLYFDTDEQYCLYYNQPIDYSFGITCYNYNIDEKDVKLSYEDMSGNPVSTPIEKGRYKVIIDFDGNRTVAETHLVRYMTIGTQLFYNNIGGSDDHASLDSAYEQETYFTGSQIELPYPELDGALKLHVKSGYTFAGWYNRGTGVMHTYGSTNQNLTNDFTGRLYLNPVFYPCEYVNPTKDNGFDVIDYDDLEDFAFQWQKEVKNSYNIYEALVFGLIDCNMDVDDDENFMAIDDSYHTGLFVTNESEGKLTIEITLTDPSLELQTLNIIHDVDDDSSLVTLPKDSSGHYEIEIPALGDGGWFLIRATGEPVFTVSSLSFATYGFEDIFNETSNKLSEADINCEYRCKITNEYGVSSYTDTIRPKVVSFETDGGVLAKEEACCLEGHTIDLANYIPVKQRYEFLGWATTENGDVVYQPDDVITLDDDVTLYAKYMTKNNQFSGTDISGTGTTQDPVTGSVSGAIAGDTYLNSSTLNMYRYDGTKWSYIGNIKGQDGITPTLSISEDGYWVINGVKTSTKATGAAGQNGTNGDDAIAPLVRINSDTNEWEISIDGGITWSSTGVKATGSAGQNGTNGNDGVDGKNGTDLVWLVVLSLTLNVALGGTTIFALVKRKEN